MREALGSVRGGGSSHSKGGNIPCLHNWEGLMAQHHSCRQKIDSNDVRIAYIEEEMLLFKDYMLNA